MRPHRGHCGVLCHPPSPPQTTSHIPNPLHLLLTFKTHLPLVYMASSSHTHAGAKFRLVYSDTHSKLRILGGVDDMFTNFLFFFLSFYCSLASFVNDFFVCLSPPRQGHLSMVVQLMKYGADPSLIDGEGCSCVHLAAQFGHTSIVAYLIAKGQVGHVVTGVLDKVYLSVGRNNIRMYKTALFTTTNLLIWHKRCSAFVWSRGIFLKKCGGNCWKNTSGGCFIISCVIWVLSATWEQVCVLITLYFVPVLSSRGSHITSLPLPYLSYLISSSSFSLYLSSTTGCGHDGSERHDSPDVGGLQDTQVCIFKLLQIKDSDAWKTRHWDVSKIFIHPGQVI